VCGPITQQNLRLIIQPTVNCRRRGSRREDAVPKKDKPADDPEDGGLDAAGAGGAIDREAKSFQTGDAADRRRIASASGAPTPAADVNNYIIDMMLQLANLAREIGNDVLATNLMKVVRSAVKSNKPPRHFL
jgi:hypothetical protein